MDGVIGQASVAIASMGCRRLKAVFDGHRHRVLPEGSPATVLDWHLDWGFAHLSEYVLERLLQMHASDVAPVLLEQAAQQDHPREALSMALAYAMRPDMSEADLMRLMHLRRSLEKPEDMSMLRILLDNDVLSDVCLRQDFLKIRETIGQNEAACHRFREAASRVKPIAETLRRHVPAQKHKKSRTEANPSQPSASGVVGTPAQRERFAARMVMPDCDVVHDFAPSGIRIRVDEFNGCFRILSQGSLRKSVSWTVRPPSSD